MIFVELAEVEGQMDGKLHVCSSGGTDRKDLPVYT